MGRGRVGSNFWCGSALRFESLKIGAEILREIPLYNCNHYCANEHAKEGNPSCPFDRLTLRISPPNSMYNRRLGSHQLDRSAIHLMVTLTSFQLSQQLLRFLLR